MNNKIRKAKGMTQEQLAEASNSSWRYIQAIEQGNRIPSLKWINSLSERLNIPLPDFFTDKK